MSASTREGDSSSRSGPGPYLVVCHQHSLGNPYTYTRTREHVNVKWVHRSGPGCRVIPLHGNGLCPGDSPELVR
jgi:hypothetical protein